MKATQQCLAAILLAGPLCLAACGDDSNAPLDPGSTVGTTTPAPDNAPPKSVDTQKVAIAADGAIAAPVSVGSQVRTGGTSARASVPQGTKAFDASGNPVTGGELQVELTTYNSKPNEGLKQFADKINSLGASARAMVPRGIGLSQIPNQLGAGEFACKVVAAATTTVVNRLEAGNGSSGTTIDSCSPAYLRWKSVSVYQGSGDFSVLVPSVRVTRSGDSGCVNFTLPNRWSGNFLGYVISGRDLAPVTGLN